MQISFCPSGIHVDQAVRYTPSSNDATKQARTPPQRFPSPPLSRLLCPRERSVPHVSPQTSGRSDLKCLKKRLWQIIRTRAPKARGLFFRETEPKPPSIRRFPKRRETASSTRTHRPTRQKETRLSICQSPILCHVAVALFSQAAVPRRRLQMLAFATFDAVGFYAKKRHSPHWSAFSAQRSEEIS